MLSKKTVLVIGAGASHEFGLPLGSQLIKLVRDDLDFRRDHENRKIGRGDDNILGTFQRLANKKAIPKSEYIKACYQLREGIDTFPSIDNYLHSHSHNISLIEAGKIGIARRILLAENKSILKINSNKDETFSTNHISGTWLSIFIKLLNSNIKADDVGNIFSKLSIICFNYDRCIEHALHELLQLSFGLDSIAATKCMKNLAIIHPYGTVGALPWQDQDNSVPFGDYERFDLDKISEGISIFTEKKENKEFNEFIDENVPNAELIMFLGYGYYKQNMDLITRRLKKPAVIVGSAKGLSTVAKSVVVNDLQLRFSDERLGPINKPSLEDMSCFELLDSHSRLIAEI